MSIKLQYVKFLRGLPLPHAAKYSGYLLMRGKDCVVDSTLYPSGINLPLNLADFVQYWMYMDGAYERPWVDFIRPRIKGKLFIDVGANVGNYAFSLCREASRIIAVEASRACCAKMRETITANCIPNVEVVHAAAWETSGESLELHVHSQDHGNNSLVSSEQRPEKETVPTVALDNVVKEAPALIKMDIEGAEMMALKGAKHLIQTHHPEILIEFNARQTRGGVKGLQEIWSFLESEGYRANEVHEGRMFAFPPSGLHSRINQNLFFTRAGS